MYMYILILPCMRMGNRGDLEDLVKLSPKWLNVVSRDFFFRGKDKAVPPSLWVFCSAAAVPKNMLVSFITTAAGGGGEIFII